MRSPAETRVPSWRSVVEHLGGAVVVLDLDGRIVAANALVHTFLGVDEDDLLGRRAWDVEAVAPHRELIRDHLTRAVDLDDPESLTLRIASPGGETLVSTWRVSFLTDDGGARTHMILIGVDVTRQHDLTDALQEREWRFRDAFARSNTVWWELDPATGRGVWTGAAASLYGIDAPPGEQSLELWRSVLHPDDREADEALMRRILRERHETFDNEYRIRHPARGERWIRTHARVIYDPDGEPVRMVGIDTDVTEQREAEERLRRSELYFRTLADALPQLVWTADGDGAPDFYNQRWADYTGRTREASIGSGWADVVHPDDRAATLAAWHGAVASGTPYGVQHRLRSATGDERWHVTRAMPVRDAGGTVVKWFGTATDVHDQKRTALDLARRTEQQTVVAELGLLASRTGEIEPLVDAATERVCRVLDADACLVLRYDPGARVAVVEHAAGLDESALGATVVADESTEAGHALASNAPTIVRDAEAEGRFVRPELFEREGLVGGVSVVIHGAAGPYGVFSVHSRTPRGFDTADTHFVQSVANLLGAALERRQDDERLRRRLRQLAVLHAIDMAITEGADISSTLATVVEHVRRELSVDAADVLIHRHGLQSLQFVAGSGFRTVAARQARMRLGESVAGTVALERRTVHVPDVRQRMHAFSRAPMLRDEGVVGYWGVPLIARGRLEGVLELFHRSELAPDAEWYEFLTTLGTQTALAINHSALFTDLQTSNANLRLAYDATIEGWARALDLKDHETEGHSRRVTERTVELAGRLGMSDEELVHVRRGALLHDIGKMAIPDRILLKRGALTEDEWAVMRTHPTIAYELLSPIPFLREAIDIPYCHHERWDGGGYPRGLAGHQIPLAARIFAVVDVYDALTSTRPYWPAWSHEQAVEHIRSEGGRHFDPAAVQAFMAFVD